MDTVYDERHPFEGREFAAVLAALSPRELRKVLRTAYRTESRKVKDIVVRKAASSGLRHGASVGRSVRVRVFPRYANGFMVTAKPVNGGRYSKGSTAKGFHKNRSGQWKPVVLWASDGTERRYTRLGLRQAVKFGRGRKAQWRTVGPVRGRMKAYPFIEDSESEAVKMVEHDMGNVLKAAAGRRLAEKAIVTGG